MEESKELEQIENKVGKPKKTLLKKILSYILVFFIGTQVGLIYYRFNFPGLTYETVLNLSRIGKLIDKNYYKDYDKQTVQDGIMTGMVFGLQDNFSYYLSTHDNDVYSGDITGNYVGIGITMSPNEQGFLEVVAPFDGSPAQKAGILPGDILFKIEGKQYMYDESDTAVDIIRGKKGEPVEIEIKRDGVENFTLSIERDVIEVESVVAKRLNDKTCYIRISHFDVTTYDDFLEKVEELKMDENTNLILDLRDNPGGVVTSATGIADSFIKDGKILTIRYKSGKEEITNADEKRLDIKYPVAVLVNQNSASASELLSGALKDTGNGYLIGEKTYGKGVVNQKFPLYGKKALVLTVAEYLTPNGTCIHEKGIEPDLKVSIDKSIRKSSSELTEEEDTQLQKAQQYIKER